VGLSEDIALFEKKLNELIVKYEHYFLGLEKREPLKLLEEVEKFSRNYTGGDIINTMLTFRYNSLKSRLASYKQYWARTMRLIEEGKYSRDRFKMGIHSKSDSPAPDKGERKYDPEMESIYRQFIQARRECNLPVKAITKEMVIELVDKHKRAAFERYGCSKVELRITVEDGNPKLKIRPRK
jgi:hypothetical protein